MSIENFSFTFISNFYLWEKLNFGVSMNKILAEKLSSLPSSSGVYLMKNRAEKIIYVGKAKILKNRVRSYFAKNIADPKTAELAKNIHDFEYFSTNNELEALLLENNLIKKYRPKYNIQLRDDKQYPFIKITINEPFPKIFITRDLQKGDAKYFGPFTDGRALRRTLHLLEWLFPLRNCNRKIGELKYERACMNLQMGKCFAPCINNISQTEYHRTVKQIIHFLNGKNRKIIDDLKEQMNQFSQQMNFEKAAQIRDKISDIQKLENSQNIFFTDFQNRDVIGIFTDGENAAVAVLKILSGKMINKEIYALSNSTYQTIPQLLNAFLKQYYVEKLENLPHQIIVQQNPNELEMLQILLKNKIKNPQRGEKKALVAIAKKNALNYVEDLNLKYLRKSARTIFPVTELKEKLGLKKIPHKMVCLDISTIQGSDTVASVVYFENGKPKKKNYRHFIIKTVIGQDDFASMAETLHRYLLKIDNEIKPDLIVIDGGKGQLSAAQEALNDDEIELISLAKKMEEIFIPNRKESVTLPLSSSALRLLIKIRDEAHRFAITFHRKRRSKRTLTSKLDEIFGIGEKMKFLLLKKFGSVENIKNVEQICEIKGIGPKIAEKIIRELEKNK